MPRRSTLCGSASRSTTSPTQEAIDKIRENPDVATESEAEESASDDSSDEEEEDATAKGVSLLYRPTGAACLWIDFRGWSGRG